VGGHVLDLRLVVDEVIAIDLVVAGAGRQMHADPVAHHQIVFQRVVLGVVDEKAASVGRHHVIGNHRILNRAQHDAVVGIAPGNVVAHRQIAHFHQCQPAAIQIDLIVFPHAMVGRHEMRAIAQMMDFIAAKQRVLGHVDVQAVPAVADIVVDDLGSAGVVDLDSVAARGRLQVAPADNAVAQNARLFRAFEPDPEQVVDQVAILHRGPVGTGLDVDPGILRSQVDAAVAHDQALERDIRSAHSDHVAGAAAANGRTADALQGQPLVDHQMFAVIALRHLHGVARLRRGQRRRNRLAGTHLQHSRAGSTGTQAKPGCQQGAAKRAQDYLRTACG